MKWLNDYVKIDMPIKQFTDGMTMSGSKVEKWSDLSQPLEKVVVGLVKSIERHADSEKLWVASVGIGGGEAVQIVTGAQNVFAGAYVPVVLDGGVVIDRHNKSITKIKKGKLRGVESCGMMCSFDELGMENSDFPYSSADGILILNDDPMFDQIRVGMDICEFVGLKDIAVEFEITNNRPDCLAVLGLAREASATFNIPFEPPVPTFTGVDGDVELKVSVENKELCSRYMAAVVKNVKIMPSPRWITERLRASGVRPINNLVDITNFVMLEYGHPMHAFDKRYVEGNEIIVRNAKDGEEITLLDGSEQVLSPEMLVIADARKPIAVAGVMGGEYSGIMADTNTVVFEAACFDGVSVRRAAKKIGRRTDASARFEKGIDPINAKDALYRALQLVEMLDCGEVMRTVIDVDNSNKTPSKLKHNYRKINELLGSDISETEQVNIFKRLGFTYDDEVGTVTPPNVRIDIELECDLAEEIARMYGYNAIKSTVPKLGTQGGISKIEQLEIKTHAAMQGMGLFECLTYSFISPKAYVKAGVDEKNRESVVILNPLGEDTSVMRTTMLPSMLEILGKNYNNRLSGGRFYEVGRIYIPKENSSLPDEYKTLGIGLYGKDEDFYTLKGITEELFGVLGISEKIVKYIPLKTNKTYHSGRAAEILINDTAIGTLGEAHPSVSEAFDIGARAYLAEIRMDKLLEVIGDAPKYRPLPKFPSMTRDLSLICDTDVTSGEIIGMIWKSGKLLEEVSFFDMYKGEQVPEGKKSLSFKLVLRKNDGTLTDTEADTVISKILKSLDEKNIKLRQ